MQQSAMPTVDMHDVFAVCSYLQQQMLVSRATPGVNTRYEWVQEAYEQLTLCKYEGRPHTGKNWDRTFTNPRYALLLQRADPGCTWHHGLHTANRAGSTSGCMHDGKVTM